MPMVTDAGPVPISTPRLAQRQQVGRERDGRVAASRSEGSGARGMSRSNDCVVVRTGEPLTEGL